MPISPSNQTSTTEDDKPQGPAQPIYVLRGHAAAVHSVCFTRHNAHLVAGDAEGWIVIWSISSKRPIAVWKAHENAMLGAAEWGHSRIITHGRDSRLYVWQYDADNTLGYLSTALPVDDLAPTRSPPWLYHALYVNTLNFCSFSSCEDRLASAPSGTYPSTAPGDDRLCPILVAVPGALDSDGIDVHCLPSETRLRGIPSDSSIKTGMVMALRIFHDGAHLRIAAGYESGHTMLFQHEAASQKWNRLYASQPHSQPVLSLDINIPQSTFYTSSADAIIAMHTLSPQSSLFPSPSSPQRTIQPVSSTSVVKPLRMGQTKHAGQQGLRVRNDGKVFATAGWDSRVRVYATKSLRELAVLKWHSDGCYSVDFADVTDAKGKHGVEEREQKEEGTVVTRSSEAQRRRMQKDQSTHWLAAGSKDGKVSLWDIY